MSPLDLDKIPLLWGRARHWGQHYWTTYAAVSQEVMWHADLKKYHFYYTFSTFSTPTLTQSTCAVHEQVGFCQSYTVLIVLSCATCTASEAELTLINTPVRQNEWKVSTRRTKVCLRVSLKMTKQLIMPQSILLQALALLCGSGFMSVRFRATCTGDPSWVCLRDLWEPKPADRSTVKVWHADLYSRPDIGLQCLADRLWWHPQMTCAWTLV